MVLAKNCIFIVEQPKHSLAERWSRFEWLCNHVAYVLWRNQIIKPAFFRTQNTSSKSCGGYGQFLSWLNLNATATEVYNTSFWMQLHGAPSPKRTILWSVMREIGNLDLGVLTREERERRTSSQTVRKYVDGSGKTRFVGTDALSKSQKLGSNRFIIWTFCHVIFNRSSVEQPCIPHSSNFY